MAQVEQQKIEDEELLLDLEDENQKYRDKVQLLNKQTKELTEQVERFSESAEEKSKFTTLVEKQNALMKSLKDSENRELDNQIAKIDYHWGTLLKSKVIEGIVPPRLQEHVHFDSLERLNRLNQSMYRAMLLVRYICEKQMPNVGSMYGGGGDSEELEMKIQFIRMMINVSEQAVMFINSAQRIIICVNNMSVEQYVKATTTLMAWQKLDAVSDEMGHIIEKLKDENISLKFDTSVLEGFIRQVSELHIKIEKLFVEKTPEELAQEGPAKKDDDKSKYQMSPAQLERQKIIQQSSKLDVRHQALRMCVATVALKVLIGEILGGGGPKNQNFMQKATLIYGRLLDIVFKLDHIDADDTGKEYLNMSDLVIDKRLTEKYDVIKMIWSDVADPVAIQGKDWNSLLDAVQRDITQVLNDYKFKRLLKHIEQSYEKEAGQATVSRIDDIFYIDRFKGALAPWMEISKRIRTDIQNSEALKDKIEQLNLKLKKEVNANLENKRQTEILKVTIKSLEGRLAKAQTEIEQLNSVKGEHESMTKKFNLQKKQLEAATTEAAGLKKYQDELLKKYEDLEKKAADGAVALEQNASYQDNLGQFRKSRGQNQPSRQSRTSTFFQELTKTSWLGGRKIDASKTPMNAPNTRGGAMMSGNSAEAQKLLQFQEDNYLNIIYTLQADRMKLRGQRITEKLNTMQRADGALNQFIKNQADKKAMNIRLTRDDQTQLVKAIENVESLKTNVKMQMASVKVVDLAQKKENFLRAQAEERAARKQSAFKRNQAKALVDPSLDKPDCVRTNMNINYMIIQARDQVNDAVKNLMSHDSKLTNLHIDKMSHQIEEDLAKNKAYASTDEDSNSGSDADVASPDASDPNQKKAPYQNTIQVGQIQIKTKDGKDQSEKVQTKNIVFKVKSLKALQNNIGVFSV